MALRSCSSVRITAPIARTTPRLTNAKFAVITVHPVASPCHCGPTMSGNPIPTYPIASMVAVLSATAIKPQRGLMNSVVMIENPHKKIMLIEPIPTIKPAPTT